MAERARDSSPTSASDDDDFYTHNYDQEGTPDMLRKSAPLPANGAHPQAEGNDKDDDSVAMDISDGSRSPTPEPEPARAAHALLLSLPTVVKRKADDPDNSNMLRDSVDDAVKKRKLSSLPAAAKTKSDHTAKLPVELWQHVFSYLSPAVLSRCLRVRKSFGAYLTSTKAPPGTKKSQSKPQVMDSDAVWARARKIFLPQLPRPLARLSELEMLQLIGGSTCQVPTCHTHSVPLHVTSAFDGGPGQAGGVRVIWPFGIRFCGRCFESHTLTDIQVLQSPSAALSNGLSFAFRTPDFHFVLEMTRQAPGGIPSHLRVAKVYYTEDVRAVQREFEDAKSYGDGAADEWRKGLASKGKEKMVDASRWEKWETQLRFGTPLIHALKEYDPAFEGTQSKSAGVNGSQSFMAEKVTHPLPQPVYTSYAQHGYGASPPAAASQYYPPPQGHFPPLQSQYLPPPAQYPPALGQFMPTHNQTQHPRPRRDPQEVEQARQARKADIERRCFKLEPSLQSNVLAHIEAFNAALQITTPLTDWAWEQLKPRILKDREVAEQAAEEAAKLLEYQKAEQRAALQAVVPTTAQDEAYLKPAREIYDKQYEQAQEPLRKRLAEYADDVIEGRWRGGKGLDKENSPTFAIEVLQHVYDRYTEDKNADLGISMVDKSPYGEPFLSLDNMKWVYDHKIRVLTEPLRRELFLCAGCSDDRKPKFFAFEGLIQHCGAKHNFSFGKGNIVVHWQIAEWPSAPPYVTEASAYMKPSYQAGNHGRHGHARHTPQSGQSGQQGPYHPPHHDRTDVDTSDGYYAHGNGYHNNARQDYYHQDYHRQEHNHQPQHTYQHPHHAQPSASAPVAVEHSYDTQLSKLTADCVAIWDSLDGIRGILACVRIQTTIHHVFVRFHKTFTQQPSLDMLTDGLATDPAMRSLKEANGLACKLCVSGQTNGDASSKSYFQRVREVKFYNLSSLIRHFQIQHLKGDTFSPNWATDMIESPERQLISEMMRMPGMNDDKLAIIAEAYPYAFPSPLPRIGQVPDAVEEARPENELASKVFSNISKKKNGKVSKKSRAASARYESYPEPSDNEYDPRRPSLKIPELEFDPARFDTDIARKASVTQDGPPAHPPPAAEPFNFGLSAETVRALSSLTAASSAQQTQQPSPSQRYHRSPSVGRTMPMANTPTITQTATGQPDIAAILASITGQKTLSQTATPPASRSDWHTSQRRPIEPYVPPPRPSRVLGPEPESWDAGSGYEGEAPPPPSFERSSWHVGDVQGTLAHNIRVYDQNQQTSVAAYTEETRSPYAVAGSPPRYRSVYDDHQQPPQAYRETPVQYIHRYEQYAAPPQYREPIYVDEQGRRLIRIEDSGVAPVQYAPHPYQPQPQPQHQQVYYDPTSGPHYDPAPRDPSS